MVRTRTHQVILLAVIFTSTALAQFKSQASSGTLRYPSLQENQQPTISLIDPERFTINHGFSLNMATLGGQTFSYGIYSNRLQYLISDKWTIQTNLDLVQGAGPLSSTFSRQNGRPFPSLQNSADALNAQIYYGTKLQYQPSQNLQFTISVDNYPRYRLYRGINPYSPFLYSPE